MLLKLYAVFWDDFSFCQQGFSALEVDQIFIGFQQHGVRKSDWCFQPAYNNNTSPTTLAGFRDKKKMLLLDFVAHILLSDKLILVPPCLEEFFSFLKAECDPYL